MSDDGRFIVEFDREALEDVPVGDAVELTVTGRLTDGPMFRGSATIRVIKPGKAAPAKPLAFKVLPAYPQPCNPEV